MTSKKSLKEGDYFYTTIDNTIFIKYNNTNIFFKGDDVLDPSSIRQIIILLILLLLSAFFSSAETALTTDARACQSGQQKSCQSAFYDRETGEDVKCHFNW